MGKNHIIELNGKRYDAVTGKIVGDVHTKKTTTPTHTVKHQNIDGFARVAQPAKPHKTQKSNTLMRGTVKKPKVTDTIQPAKQGIVPHKQVHSAIANVPAEKLKQAQAIPKSTVIQRFNAVMTPKATQAQTSTPPKVMSPSVTQVTPRDQTQTIINGLAQATSHEETILGKPKRHHRIAKKLRISPKLVSAGGFTLAALLIGGFFTYQNIPNLNMRIAASRSGVQGTLPSYKPAGFRLLGNITYKPGEIILGYRSTSDDRTFDIKQTVSAWNSEALRDNFVAANYPSHQIINTKGKTIYLYNDSNATWVDGGIWYRIEGTSKLNSDQLQNLANSL